MNIDKKIIDSFLRYDPQTGDLYWVPRAKELFVSDRVFKMWNTRFVGKKAFTCTGAGGYKQGRLMGRHFLAHRVIWVIMTGRWPNKIDHINGIKSDNRWKNLRDADASVNQKNRKLNHNNTSGYSGVTFHSSTGKWQVCLSKKYFGLFDNLDDAIQKRKLVEIEHGYHPNHGRIK